MSKQKYKFKLLLIFVCLIVYVTQFSKAQQADIVLSEPLTKDTSVSATNSVMLIPGFNSNGFDFRSMIVGESELPEDGELLPPTNLQTIYYSEGMVKLTWEYSMFNIEGFIIQRSEDSPDNFQELVTTSKEKNYYINNNDVIEGKTYFYRVIATNFSEQSTPAEIQITIPYTLPKEPENLVVQNVTENQVTISWEYNYNNQTEFIIERSKYSVFNFEEIDRVPGNVVTYTDSTVESGRPYYYRIKANNDIGSSVSLNTIETFVPQIVLGIPEITDINSTNEGLDIYWDTLEEMVDSIEIERSSDGNPFFTIAKLSGTEVHYIDNDVIPLTTYTYRIRTEKQEVYSSFSSEVYQIATSGNGSGSNGAFDKPDNIQPLSVTSNQVVIQWDDNSQSEEGFYIERKTSGGQFVQISKVGTNITYFTDRWLMPNTEYIYRIRAYGTRKASFYSDESVILTTDKPNGQIKERYAVNFGSDASVPKPWNAFEGIMAFTQIDNIINTEQIPSFISVSLTDSWDSINLNGAIETENNIFPDIVQQSCMKASNSSGKGISITGLTLNGYYNIIVYSSQYEEKIPIMYSATGQDIVLNPFDNTYKTAEFEHIQALNGTIEIEISSIGESSSFCINAMVIEAFQDESANIVEPTNLTATSISNNRIKLDWEDNNDFETGFYVYRTVGSSYEQQVAILDKNITTFTDCGLLPNTYYGYQVVSFEGESVSSKSNTAGATTMEDTDIQNFYINFSGSTHEPGWNYISDIESIDNTTILLDNYGDTSVVSLTIDEGLSTGSCANSNRIYPQYVQNSYFYLEDDDWKQFVISNLSPSSEYLISFLASNSLSYNSSTEFRINDSSIISNAANSNSILATFKNVKANLDNKIIFDVRRGTDAYEYGYLNAVVIETDSNGEIIPYAPDGFTASVSSLSSITLTWNDTITNEDGYILERKTLSDIIYSPIANLPANSDSFTDVKLDSATTYQYRLKSYNKAGCSNEHKFSTASTQSTNNPEQYLLSYFNFDEDYSSTTVEDKMNYATGTLVGEEWAYGVGGEYLRVMGYEDKGLRIFNGDGILQLGTESSYFSDTEAQTWVIWFKQYFGGDAILLNMPTGSGNFNECLRLGIDNNNVLYASASDLIKIETPFNLYSLLTSQITNWHQAVLQWEPGTKVLRLFFDGQMIGEEQSLDVSFEPPLSGNVMTAGNAIFNNGSDQYPFTGGVIDELKIYRGILSPQEIEELYGERKQGPFYFNAEDYSTTSIKLKWTDTISNIDGYFIEKESYYGSHNYYLLDSVHVDSFIVRENMPDYRFYEYIDTDLDKHSTGHRYRIRSFYENGSSWYAGATGNTFIVEPYTSSSQKNSVLTTVFDEYGNVVSQSINYANLLGKPTQTISRNVTEENVTVAMTLYDSYGRGVISTLPAVVNQQSLDYVDDFITNSDGYLYDYYDFDGTNLNTPDIVNSNSPLGTYYSDDNEFEDYVPTTSYPYTRVEYSQIQPGATRKSTLAGDVHRMGLGHEMETYSMTVPESELYSYANTDFNIGESSIELDYKGLVKTISIDPDGKSSVVYTNTNGNVVASCLGTGGDTKSVTYIISVSAEDASVDYADIHIPEGCENSLVLDFSQGQTYNIYNLQTDELEYSNVTSQSQVSSIDDGLYRVVYIGSYAITFNITYNINYDEHSFNFYDKTGQLKYSLSPKGYDDWTNSTNTLTEFKLFTSQYHYNSLGWLLYSTEPDIDHALTDRNTYYNYRNDGAIRFSQNPQQREDGVFSYTNYDDLGRVIESGECEESASGIEFRNHTETSVSGTTLDILETRYTNDEFGPNGISSIPSYCHDQTYLLYDEPASDWELTDYPQNFTIGAVSKSWNANATTWYGYTYDGKIEWMAKQVYGLDMDNDNTDDILITEYEYDFNGNVTSVTYQKDFSDKFTHEYVYDYDKRLKSVKTIDNTGSEKLQAKYSYYKHGALKRTELGGNVQGIDYVYTINGWLKSINHPSLDAADDPGNDGGDSNPSFAPDAFGMSLDYHTNDYSRSGTNINRNLINSYYNGNIAAQRWNTNGLEDENYTLMTGYQWNYDYNYDNHNWLVSAYLGQTDGVSLLSNVSNKYDVSGLAYDLNGNIQTLTRFDGNSDEIDNLTYNYYGTTNKLEYVDDAIGASKYGSDIGDQAAGNYVYNNIGQLVSNVSDGHYFEYDVYGKVTAIYSDAGKTTAKVYYYYDENGYRIAKENIESGKITWYVRDNSGNILSIYTNDNDGGNILPEEFPIYASSRIGTAYTDDAGSISSYVYEITDHLGNVRATVDDDYFTTNTLLSFADYYPMGMVIPGREKVASHEYRFGYQGQFAEKDGETGYNQFEARLYDSRIGRWMVPDPAGQYFSPYLGMGNNPVMGVDPDGKFFGKLRANRYKNKNGGQVFKNDYGDWYVVNDLGEGNFKATSFGGSGVRGHRTPEGEKFAFVIVEENIAIKISYEQPYEGVGANYDNRHHSEEVKDGVHLYDQNTPNGYSTNPNTINRNNPLFKRIFKNDRDQQFFPQRRKKQNLDKEPVICPYCNGPCKHY